MKMNTNIITLLLVAVLTFSSVISHAAQEKEVRSLEGCGDSHQCGLQQYGQYPV